MDSVQDTGRGRRAFFFSFFFCFTLSRFLSFFPANLHHALGLMSLAIDPLRPMPQAGEALKENSQKTSTKRHEFGHSLISYSANLGHVTIEMSFFSPVSSFVPSHDQVEWIYIR